VIECAGKTYKTKALDGAGKNPVWNETFLLTGILQEVEKGNKLHIKTFDDDGLTSDFIG
tara:strand:+ start:29 stop:205 length:177 start_codon:yes stop_codon:yes gene_type:complete